MSDERVKAAAREYEAFAHAMQTGVAYSDPDQFGGERGTVSNTLKHLRVGVNSAMVDHSALASLLIEKGIITKLEYVEALRDAMRAEVERYTVLVAERLGTPVTLQ
jgi:hypothetical protein